MRFEWDAAKNAKNLAKHGIDFRFVAYGAINRRLYAIVWTPRDADMVRLISARKANAREIKRFGS